MNEAAPADEAGKQPGTRDPQPRARGRPPRLDREMIVEAALAVLDEGSVDQFTMAKLAQRLGVGVMTLYSYFPSRDALLIAVSDEIYSRFEYPAANERWQDAIHEWMWATVRLFRRYPVAQELSLWEGRASPGWLRTWLPVIALIRAQGIDGARLAFAVRWFTTSSIGFITAQPPLTRREDRLTGHAPAMSPDEAAMLHAIQAELIGVDGDAALAFGFTHMIAGLERIIAEATASASSQTIVNR